MRKVALASLAVVGVGAALATAQPRPVPPQVVIKDDSVKQGVAHTLDCIGAVGCSVASGVATVNVNPNSATATALASDPTDCAGNEWARGITASGNATCAQLAFSNISSTLALSQLTDDPMSGNVLWSGGPGGDPYWSTPPSDTFQGAFSATCFASDCLGSANNAIFAGTFKPTLGATWGAISCSVGAVGGSNAGALTVQIWDYTAAALECECELVTVSGDPSCAISRTDAASCTCDNDGSAVAMDADHIYGIRLDPDSNCNGTAPGQIVCNAAFHQE